MVSKKLQALVKKRIEQAKKKKIFDKSRKIAITLGEYKFKRISENEGIYRKQYTFNDPKKKIEVTYCENQYNEFYVNIRSSNLKNVFEARGEIKYKPDLATIAEIGTLKIITYIPGFQWELTIDDLYRPIERGEQQERHEQEIKKEENLRRRFGLEFLT